MNRRTLLKVLLAIPGVSLVAKTLKQPVAAPTPEPAKTSVLAEVRQLQDEVLQNYGQQYWENCYWKVGIDFRSAWFQEGITIANRRRPEDIAALIGSGTRSVFKTSCPEPVDVTPGLNILGLNALVCSPNPRHKDYWPDSTLARLFHGDRVVGFVMTDEPTHAFIGDMRGTYQAINIDGGDLGIGTGF